MPKSRRPRRSRAARVRYATAGVGTTPALVTDAPSPHAPCASSASIQAPDSRVSRPTSSRGDSAVAVRQRAHERGAEAADGRRIERRAARPCRARRRCRTVGEPLQFLPLEIRTCTVAGFDARHACIRRSDRRAPSACIAPAPSPARSTYAATSSVRRAPAPRGCRAAVTSTAGGHRLRPASPGARLRRCTGRSRSVRSSGAGTISTVTIAERAASSAAATGSRKPMITVSRHRRCAPPPRPARSSPRCTRSTALSGPTTSTVSGSDGHLADDVAGRADRPSIGRHDRHLSRRRRLERQRHRRRHHLHHLARRTARAPARASAGTAAARLARVRRSSTATMSPAPTRLSVPDAPRTRTSTVAGASPCSSRPAGNCCSSSGTRSPRSTVSSPDDDHPEQHAPGRATAPSGRNGGTARSRASSRVLHLAASALAARRCSSSDRSRARSASASRPRSIWPSTTIEIAAGLLGHDDRHRVVLFGEADRGAMPRSELLAELRVHGQRQETGGRRHAIVLHDHGAVVQRRVGLEDAHAADRRSAPRRAGCRPRCSCAGRSAARSR